MSLDISKLSSFSQEAYHKLILLHPEWEKYAKIETTWADQLWIEIPSPVPEIFPLEIASEDDLLEEITIWFGPAHRHLCWRTPKSRHSLDGQLLTLEEIVQQIFNEELIAIQKKPRFSWVAEGLVEHDEYKKLLDKGKLRRAVSWKGTFNYPYDGTHLEWNPKIRT